ncbi:MAG: hypothetical protein KGJ98_08675 [Chloroflexota bacterium]|nr:hypothetical protein [Chloroflexota bacterium]
MSLEAPRSATGVRRTSVTAHCALAKEVLLLETVANTIARSSPQHALDDVDGALILLERVASHARVEHELRFRLAYRDHQRVAIEFDRVEADRLTRRLGALSASLARGDAETALEEIRPLLYELHALTRLHFAGELVDAAHGGSSTEVDEQPRLLATR